MNVRRGNFITLLTGGAAYQLYSNTMSQQDFTEIDINSKRSNKWFYTLENYRAGLKMTI